MPADPDILNDRDILDAMKSALLSNPAVTEIQVDGIRVKVNWDLLKYYERKVTEANGSNPFCASLDMRSFP